ncbi:GNAT family N-acetyltransferase [Nocardioides daeguensis]|uniref:GNAT family N-acetyltransferase n=1 Tax=Nocardioides daeguensis TaxID=908359 RepID=A0ABP6W0F7_9ACTN|nr:GNAT family N-acetyltransferase [Nocardioides daeguensis]MBV6726775.1 GNAT family N-acetyltransferase [Nocardioides daeguensis]MCR1774473.1 GNAT family N-acetyltransferase [Nocardioides daeguensis]
MDIRPFTPDDLDDVAAWTDLVNAIADVDAPWTLRQTVTLGVGQFRHGWDGEPESPYLLRVGDVAVGWGSIATSDYDNLDLAFLTIGIHPDHQRRGYGTALLDLLRAEARRRGRTSLLTEAWETRAGDGFATRHGFERRLASISRRQLLADVDRADLEQRYDEALPHAADYALERWTPPTPDERLADVAAMASSINDAPTDDLDYEDEVFTPERVRAYEEASAARGFRQYRLVARHLPTGELAGQSVVVVVSTAHAWGRQHDTTVTRPHRGHRLGLLLKIGMLRWLAEAEPALERIDTWNAESNDQMIGVNETLGYRVMGREWTYQRPLD